MTRAEFLQKFPPLSKMPERALRDLLDAGQLRTFPGGTQIYREGDACSAIAFLLGGEIRVYKIGQTGREITLYEIGPGETCILNASCILAGRSYPAHAVTLDAVSALLVPADLFRSLVREHEPVRDFVFLLLSERLAGVMELVEEVAFGRMDSRLMDYLIVKSDHGRIEATHQKIANDLGTSREVVSRLLKHYEHTGAVRLSRNSVLLSEKILKNQ